MPDMPTRTIPETRIETMSRNSDELNHFQCGSVPHALLNSM
jgi:hypothetical protein